MLPRLQLQTPHLTQTKLVYPALEETQALSFFSVAIPNPFTRLKCETDLGGNGGAIYASNVEVAVWNTTIGAPNTASISGPNETVQANLQTTQSASSQAKFFINDTVFINNIAHGYGGAIAVRNAFASLVGCNASRNFAGIGGGFAAMLHPNASLRMASTNPNNFIKDNVANDAGMIFYTGKLLY